MWGSCFFVMFSLDVCDGFSSFLKFLVHMQGVDLCLKSKDYICEASFSISPFPFTDSSLQNLVHIKHFIGSHFHFL